MKRKLTTKENTRYKKYGISPFHYNQMLRRQHNVCAICGGKDYGRDLAVDHDHETGAVRGLLCMRCNTGLGCFLDDIRLLSSAIIYLEDNAII